MSVRSTKSTFAVIWHDASTALSTEVSVGDVKMSNLLRRLESAFFALVDFLLDA